mgnify:CR=1 FL=1
MLQAVLICDQLEVSPTKHYALRARQLAMVVADVKLAATIQEVHWASNVHCAVPRDAGDFSWVAGDWSTENSSTACWRLRP